MVQFPSTPKTVRKRPSNQTYRWSLDAHTDQSSRRGRSLTHFRAPAAKEVPPRLPVGASGSPFPPVAWSSPAGSLLNPGPGKLNRLTPRGPCFETLQVAPLPHSTHRPCPRPRPRRMEGGTPARPGGVLLCPARPHAFFLPTTPQVHHPQLARRWIRVQSVYLRVSQSQRPRKGRGGRGEV